MKKLNYLLLGLAGLAMASCSQEDIVGPADGNGNVSITVQLPGDLGTRAEIGDGLAANKLYLAVYDQTEGTSVFSFEDEADFGNSLSTTVNLNLINGKTYQIAFFAASETATIGTSPVYVFNPETESAEGAALTPNITVNYENMTSAGNVADAYDCFFKEITFTLPASSSDTQPFTNPVQLDRIVAQLNWGTNEIGANNEINSTFGEQGQNIYTNVTFTQPLYTTFNMLEGDVDETAKTEAGVIFSGFQAPYQETFPVAGYNYVAMNYVLMPASDSETYSVSIDIYNSDNTSSTKLNFAEADNVPLQGNYRTNIYGTLLSNNVQLTVTKDPNWNTPDFNEPYPAVWDGTTVTIPTQDAEGNYVIASPSDLAGLAAMVNGTNGQTASDLSGTTFVLEADIDMGGKPFPGIGTATYLISEYDPFGTVSGTTFKGSINGQNHTISNLTIEGKSDQTAALIPVLEGGTVKNINFDNVSIDGVTNKSNQTALVGMITQNGSVSNVSVSGTVMGFQYTGAVVGAIISEGSVTNCTNNATVTGSKYMGGVIGAAMYPVSGKTMTVSGCNNSGAVTSSNLDAAKPDSKYVGGVIGFSSANVSNCNNSGAITSVLNSTGGVVGEQRNTGYVKNCVNTGNVTQTGSPQTADIGAAGGIVGWVRYWNYNYTVEQNPIVVSGNTNYASVSGNLYVGGIFGMWYYSGVCEDNASYALKITASQELAGGLGVQQWVGNQPTFTDGQPLGKLIIENNKVSTPESDITAPSNVDQFVYLNSPNNVEFNNNTVVDHQNPPTEL